MTDRAGVESPAIVAFGGGHGLYATLSALRRLSPDVTAVVTVADDGGSSGRLRSELGVIPPGDLRMAVAALVGAVSGDDRTDVHDRWAEVLQHRFGGRGALAGHPVGNLLLAGLTEVLGEPVAALDELMRVLGADGRVLPMSTIPLDIEADVFELEADPRISRCIRGQVAVATTPGKVRRVRLLPSEPPPCEEVLAAIARAQVITLGPGSWFSSVIPHVLVPAQLAAVQRSDAHKILIVNLAPEIGETPSFSLERHLRVLAAHADRLRIDDVIVDAHTAPAGREREYLEKAAADFGAVLRVSDVSVGTTNVHDPAKLATVIDQYVHR